MVHLCNCQFCTNKSVCLVCGSKESLDRAHIVPQRVINAVLENDSVKEKFLSFEGPNVFALCRKHHIEFDRFVLENEFKEILRPHIDNLVGEFMGYITGKSVLGYSRVKMHTWATKLNAWLYGGGEVVTFRFLGTVS